MATPAQPLPAQLSDAELTELGRTALSIEAAAVTAIGARLGADFARACRACLACHGRVVVIGMGKSGHIGSKIAATLASTGTPAFFVHPAEAVHGDLGMITPDDLVIALSNSGETSEVLALIPVLRRLGVPIVALTGNGASTLAQAAAVHLDVSVPAEACPMNLTPTASTTATLAMGDALAVAVLEAKGFTDRDFAMLHPGGALGRKLLRVEEVMHERSLVPLVGTDDSVLAALNKITDGRLGTAGIVDSSGALVGVITDGDIRRAVLRHGDLSPLAARDVMAQSPKTVSADALAEEALATMERYQITSLFILDGNSRPVGIIHLHDLLKAGVV